MVSKRLGSSKSLTIVFLALLSSATYAAPTKYNNTEEDPPLGLQIAQRMVQLKDLRPTPSLGYLLSYRMVRSQQKYLDDPVAETEEIAKKPKQSSRARNKRSAPNS